jgi:hypothetical protein
LRPGHSVTAPSPHLVLSVAIILMLLPVVINIISIQVVARVNNVAVFTEIIGTVVFGVLLFILWGMHAKPTKYGAGILTNTTSVFHNPTWYAFALAGLLGAFTLVGASSQWRTSSTRRRRTSSHRRDPDRRFELQLALRVRQLDESRMAGRESPPRSARLDTEPSTDGQPSGDHAR